MLQYVIDHLNHDFTVLQSFIPENLHFTLNDEAVSTIEYQISDSALDLSGNPVITGDNFIRPQHNMWRLRYGPSINIAAGVITDLTMEYGEPYMSVAGADWMWYFQKRFMPFDGRPANVYDYVIGTPPQGLSYNATNVDIATALDAILDMVLGRTDSLPITYTLAATSILMDHFRLDLADTTSLLEIVKQICAYNPGVAFEITPGRVFQISSGPRWYGDPVDVVADGPTGANLVWVIDGTHPPQALTFGNSGPDETHIQAEGDGTTTRTVVSLGNAANQAFFWRTDRAVQVEHAITRTAVEERAHEQFAFDLNPVHEIPLTLDPDVVDKQYDEDQSDPPGTNDGFFWTNFKPGRAIWIDLQLIAHHIDSPHHIASMDCTVKPNGVAEVTIQQNQIYDTTGQAHTAEG